MPKKAFNLFVYGTFMDRRLFRWVTGHDYALPQQIKSSPGALLAHEAILAGHQKISPDDMYFYAITRPGQRISGYVIHELPIELLELLDHYEGKRYKRTQVIVHQDDNRIQAYTYLANEKALRQAFGDRFRVNLKHEHIITKRVEEFLARRAVESADSALLPRYRVAAEEELRGLTIRDLIRTRLESGVVADYFLKKELSSPLLSLDKLRSQPEAQPLIGNYLAFLIRQVFFNQTEQRFLEQFRFDLDHLGFSARFYEHTTSSVAALKMLNDRPVAVEQLTQGLLKDFDLARHDLLDVVAWAIHAAESLYDPHLAEEAFRWLREHIHGGLLPLGAELEFSNVGHAVIANYDTGPGTKDGVFDGFRYFSDFALPALTWRLGGHLDDHQAHRSEECVRGFLEFSPGAFSFEPRLSMPATKDPWLLAQLIHNLIRFCPVKPHSLHLSVQLPRHHTDPQNVLPLDFAKCLLVLGGDPQAGLDKRLQISRITSQEIGSPDHKDGLVFARISRRQATSGDQEDEPTVLRPGRPVLVQQFKFIRLAGHIDYEILILALKGLQLALDLGDYITPKQLEKGGIVNQFSELFAWSHQPQPIDPKVIESFCWTILEGLAKERRGQLAHKNTYVQWALHRIASQIKEFNKSLAK